NGGAGTDYDFVRFYADAKPEGLEATIGALADRMTPDSARFSAQTLQRDQDIVMSEIRRATNVDWDLDVMNHLAAGTFGADHPYNHAVGGLESDIRAASVPLMQEWHRRYAGAANMLVIVVGNFEPAIAERIVARHFGSLRPGPPLARVTQWIPVPRNRHDRLEKDVARGVVYLRWPVPPWGDPATADLALFARVMSHRGGHSRRGNSATLDSVSASIDLGEIAGSFTLRGVAANGTDTGNAEAALRALLATLLRDGPSDVELARAKAEDATAFALSLQQLGDRRNGRADAIGLGQYYFADPDRWRVLRTRADAATPSRVRDTARRWLTEPGYVLHVVPRIATAMGAPYDRATPVSPLPVRRPSAPRLIERTLANGMRLIVVERTALPLAQLTLAFNAGSGTDTPANAGRARVALDALTRLPVDARGTTLDDALAQLGARSETRLDRDYAVLDVSLMNERVPAAIALLASALSRPAPEALLSDATRAATQRLERVVVNPVQARRRALGCLMLVPCAPAALDGLGTRGGLVALTVADLRAFYATYYGPGNTLLVASGRVDTASLERQLAAALGAGSRGSNARVPAQTAAPAYASAGGAAMLDYPTAPLTYLLLAQPLPPEVASDPAMLQLARLVNLAFRQRLMANLREAKGWSYEVYPFSVEADRRGAFMLFDIPLQPDKVGDAIAEIRTELTRLRDDSLNATFLAQVSAVAASAGVPRDLSSLERINTDVLELARSGRSA
ncbi:MAG: M16 family metallopeptidase, partial [Gemmatimonadaceae bacterium]